MSSMDSDLRDWRQSWQGFGRSAAVPDLRKQVLRETRQARIGLLAPLAVTLIIGGGVAGRALDSGEGRDISLAAGVWFFIACAWAGCGLIARDTWAPRDQTTLAFLELSIARCRSVLRAVPFGIALYLVELSFLLFWFIRYTDRAIGEILTSLPIVLVGWLGAPALFAGAMHWRRVKRAQCDALLDLRRECLQP